MSTKTQQLQIRVSPRQKAALRRLAAAANQDLSSYVLSKSLPRGRLRLEELLVLAGEEAHRRFALAELNDLLTGLVGVELADTVEHAQVSQLPPFVQNYIAAMVEQAVYMKGVRPPSWVAEVPPLEAPHFAVPFHGLRLHLLRASPVPFKRRNIFIDSSIGARV